MRYLLGFFLLISGFFQAQDDNSIQWKKELKDLGNGLYEVKITADLEPGWHLYTPNNTNEFIIPTVVNFMNSSEIDWQGKQKISGKIENIFDQGYKEELNEYTGDVTFTRKFKRKTDKPFMVQVEVQYQVCNDRFCKAPEDLLMELSVAPAKSVESTAKASATEEDTKNNNEDQEAPKVEENGLGSTADSSNIGKEAVAAVATGAAINAAKKGEGGNGLIIPSINVKKPLYQECGDSHQTDDKQSLWLLFGLGFLGGLLAMLTPCVYPMIPLTVSFFTKSTGEHSGKGNALMYAFFIFIIFILISLPFHLFNLEPDLFNQISTNVWVNLFFFVVFVFFAFSFFGYYDLTLPQSWLDKSEKLSGAGGLIGIFFMALTLVIVSFSCTGPILGGLLGTISGADGPNKLTSAFAGFGLSWAIIFGTLALFPQLLKSMPSSGGWLNTTKVVLGFIELALALKFLSVADLVTKTFWLKRELFVLIWIVIAICTILYMLGFIRFPHDERPNKITTGKRVIALIFLGISLYLIPGIFPNHNKPNLKLLSGITPPMTVSYFTDNSCPLGLSCTHDYFEAVERAKTENKPILIDFTGWGCANCRKMEEEVWSDKDVFNILQNKVVLASLYVDEDKPLVDPYTIELKNGNKRLIKTVGNEWSVFQNQNFESNIQPQYVMLTPDQQVLNYPVGGFMSKDDFLKFLECGLSAYNVYESEN